jgi:hypothetical protein
MHWPVTAVDAGTFALLQIGLFVDVLLIAKPKTRHSDQELYSISRGSGDSIADSLFLYPR